MPGSASIRRRAEVLVRHFEDADRRGKTGHGFSRIAWLESVDFDPAAQPDRVAAEEGFERWAGNGALGYLVLEEIARSTLEAPPDHARVVVAERCFPTGVLGYWARRLAEGGLVAALTTTSPRRLPHPEGGPPLTGTNPLAIAIPSTDGLPLVADVSMGAVTHGDVLEGKALPEELVPFGGDQAYKAFALAAGLELSSPRSQARSPAPCSSSRDPGTIQCPRSARSRPDAAYPAVEGPAARAVSASSWAAAWLVIPRSRARAKTPASVSGIARTRAMCVLDVVAAGPELAAHVDDAARVDDVVRRVEDARGRGASRRAGARRGAGCSRRRRRPSN